MEFIKKYGIYIICILCLVFFTQNRQPDSKKKLDGIAYIKEQENPKNRTKLHTLPSPEVNFLNDNEKRVAGVLSPPFLSCHQGVLKKHEGV
jgi:hypothetical protein